MSPRVPEPHLSAWQALLQAHASVVARVEDALAEAGLPPLAWYDVLWALRSAPGRRVRMAELAGHLTLSRGGLTKLAGRLETAGLLRREAAHDDGRGVYAVLTKAGEALLRKMWPVYSRVLRETFVDAISADEAATIATGLHRAKAAATPGASPPGEIHQANVRASEKAAGGWSRVGRRPLRCRFDGQAGPSRGGDTS